MERQAYPRAVSDAAWALVVPSVTLMPADALQRAPSLLGRKRLAICTGGQYIPASGCHRCLAGAGRHSFRLLQRMKMDTKILVTLVRRNHDAPYTCTRKPQPPHSRRE